MDLNNQNKQEVFSMRQQWPALLVFLLTGSGTGAVSLAMDGKTEELTKKIEQVEDVVKQQAVVNEKIRNIKEDQSEIKNEQKAQSQVLQEILQQVRQAPQPQIIYQEAPKTVPSPEYRIKRSYPYYEERGYDYGQPNQKFRYGY